MGPLLYLIYVNDLADKLSCDPHFFADDTFLLDPFNDALISSVKVTGDLDVLRDWGTNWKITSNPSKTRFMVASKKQQHADYPEPIFDNTPIVRTDKHKHLGLIISSDFTWTAHIDSILIKSSRRLHQINSVRHLLPRRSLCSMYQTNNGPSNPRIL